MSLEEKKESIIKELKDANRLIRFYKSCLVESEIKKESLELLLARTDQDIEHKKFKDCSYANALRLSEEKRMGYEE